MPDDFEHFLYREARLIDEQRYAEWLELLAPDIVYTVPNFSDDPSRPERSVVLREDCAGLRARVARLAHARNPTRMPPARTLHVIANVVAEPSGNTARVTSNLVLYVSKDGAVRDYAAHVVHVLARVDGQWRISAKTVYLLANDLALGQLTLI